jgi:hypothetical protein
MPRPRPTDSACPFLDLDDERCASHFSLGRLSEAFDICVNRHLGCPTYYRLLREHNLVTHLTLHGRTVFAAAGRSAAG